MGRDADSSWKSDAPVDHAQCLVRRAVRGLICPNIVHLRSWLRHSSQLPGCRHLLLLRLGLDRRLGPDG